MRSNLTLYSWACYDFANTIFSAVVLTFYFPLYLTALTQRNFYLGVTTTVAMALAGFVVPWLGALSDRTGKTKFYLIVMTVICILCTTSLSFFLSPLLLLGAFLLACFFFHASLVFYNALLPGVAPSENQGFASGLGTALGYLGVLVAIPIAHLVDAYFGRRYVFLTAALLYFFFSLPLFFWVPERRTAAPALPSLQLGLEEWRKVGRTLLSLRTRTPLLFFFLGNLLVMEAVNTVVFWLVIYITRVFSPPQVYLIVLFLGLNFAAFFFGFASGFLTDHWGAKKTLQLAAASFFVSLTILALVQQFWLFALVSLTGGALGLAGVWTAARKRVVELSPSAEIGEYFGLYNLTTKISVVGSLVFSFLADRWGFQAALLSQLIPSGVGLFLLILSKEAKE